FVVRRSELVAVVHLVSHLLDDVAQRRDGVPVPNLLHGEQLGPRVKDVVAVNVMAWAMTGAVGAAVPKEGPAPVRLSVVPVLDGTAAPTDRKSTRLNSSHDQISYAVFCLKKKKKNIHNTL